MESSTNTSGQVEREFFKEIETDESEKIKEIERLKRQKVTLEDELVVMGQKFNRLKHCEEELKVTQEKIDQLIDSNILDEYGNLIKS